MLTQFAIYTVIASVVGSGYSVLSRSKRIPSEATAPPGSETVLSVSILLWSLLLFFFTVPARAPFSSGQTLGTGFLVGAALGILVMTFSGRRGEDAQGLDRSMLILSLACLGSGALLWIYHGYPDAALMGFALGAVFVAAFGDSATRRTATGFASIPGSEVFALASVALVAAISLGIEHFPRAASDSAEGGYWAAPALMLAGGALCLGLMAEGDRERNGWRSLIAGVAAGGFSVAVCAALGFRLLPSLVWTVPLGGVLTFGFLLFLFMQDERANDESQPLSLAIGSLFLILAVLALAFRASHAYGMALALLPAILVVSVCVLSRDGFRDSLPEGVATGGFVFALLLTLCRLYMERVGQGRDLDFQHFYDLFALFLGVSAGFLLLDRFGESASEGEGRFIRRLLPFSTLVAGFATAAAPLSVLAIFGSRSTGTFLVGLAASEMIWVALASWSRSEDRRGILAAAPHLRLLASSLIAIQFAPFVLALNLTRTQKAILALVLGAIVFIGLATNSARRNRASRRSHEIAA